MKELTGAPLRIATRQRITTPYTRNIKLTYIVGTQPLVDTFVNHPLKLLCNTCSWVLQNDGRFKLKYVDRNCNFHTRLIGPRER